jgi:hypothetical protein
MNRRKLVMFFVNISYLPSNCAYASIPVLLESTSRIESYHIVCWSISVGKYIFIDGHEYSSTVPAWVNAALPAVRSRMIICPPWVGPRRRYLISRSSAYDTLSLSFSSTIHICRYVDVVTSTELFLVPVSMPLEVKVKS